MLQPARGRPLLTGSASFVAALAFSVALATPVSAQSSAAAAEALFEKGLAAMQRGDLDEACPALAESYRLDPRPGGLFTLAECENKAGRIATAATHYEDYLRVLGTLPAPQRAAQRAREKVSQEQVASIKPRIPKLTLRLAEGTPPGAVVYLGKLELGAPSLGVALPVDPGKHVLRVEAPGRQASELAVLLAEGEARTVELSVASAESEAGPEPATPPPATAPEQTSGGSGLTPVALVVGGVGLAGLVVGGVTGAMVFAQKSTVDENCLGNVCNAEGLEATESASTLGLVSTIGFIAGGTLLATGVVLLLVDGGEPEAANARSFQLVPYASPEGAGLGFGMRF